MGYQNIEIRDGLLNDICAVLSCYEGDLDFWVNAMDIESLNAITAQTPEFETIAIAKAYRTRVGAVLREVYQLRKQEVD